MGKQFGTMTNLFQDKNIAEYLLTEDKSLIDIVLQNVKPKKVITSKYKGKIFQWEPKVNDFFSLKYKWVILIKENLNSPTLGAVKDILTTVYDIRTDQQFMSCSVFDVFAAYAWIVEEVEGIYEVEKEKLFKKPTNKQKAAGIEEFEQLDNIPTIDALANGNILEWDKILELPYGQVLRKMLLNKIQNEYNERYSKLK